MNERVAKRLRKRVNLKNINKARDDVTYSLIPTSYFCCMRRIKDEALKRYKRAKQMYKDEDLKEYVK